ncbi:MAG: universal stress protein, partial [Solirubrobacteraceae bacterium]
MLSATGPNKLGADQRQEEPEMFTNVVVGVNGDQGARDALALTANLLAKGGELTLVHVYPENAFTWRGPVGARDDTNDERTADLQHEASRRTGVKARLRWYACSSVARGLH